MTFEKELPEWKEKGVKPPQSKIDEGWKVQDKPPAAWLNWQMNKTYEALKEVQEKAAEKIELASAIEDSKKYTDQKVSGIDLTKITPDSIGATKKTDFDTHTADKTKHITEDERNAWNAKETLGGAQAKANQAETNAKNYIDSKAWQKHKVASDDGTAIDISNRDLNSIVHTGFYKGTNMGNSPALLHGWGYVEVIAHGLGSWVLQKVYDLHADRFYMRRLQDNGWTAWTQDLFQSGVDAKNSIAGAINAKGVPASANDDFATLAAKISQIKTELSLVDSKISWSNTHSPSMYGDDKKVVYDYVVATMPNMKNAFAFDGSIWLDNEKTNSDNSAGSARAYLEDWNGKTCDINSIGHSTRWGYNYATNIFMLNGRKGYKTVTSFWDGDKEATHTSTSIQIPDGFDVSRPCLLKVKWEFYPIAGRFYQVSISCRVNGTITTC